MYSIVIWLDDEINKLLNRYRLKYDKHYSLIAPHITVLFPIYPKLPEAEVIGFIEGILNQLQPFELHFDRWEGFAHLLKAYPLETEALVSHFPDCRNMVVFPVQQGRNELLQIRKLIGIVPYFPQPEALLCYPHYLPVGHDLDDERYRELLHELEQNKIHFKVNVTTLDLLKQSDSGKWDVVQSFQLNG